MRKYIKDKWKITEEEDKMIFNFKMTEDAQSVSIDEFIWTIREICFIFNYVEYIGIMTMPLYLHDIVQSKILMFKTVDIEKTIDEISELIKHGTLPRWLFDRNREEYEVCEFIGFTDCFVVGLTPWRF